MSSSYRVGKREFQFQRPQMARVNFAQGLQGGPDGVLHFFFLPVGWVSQTKDVRLRNSGAHSGLTEVDLSEDCWRR